MTVASIEVNEQAGSLPRKVRKRVTWSHRGPGEARPVVAHLAGLNKCSRLPHPHSDAWPYIQALVEAYTPQCLVWGSDWPFLRAPARIDYGPLLKLFEHVVPDLETRREIGWHTPKRLFRFGG